MFLKHQDDNLIEQVLRELTQKDVLLHLRLVNRVDLVNEVEIGGYRGHSDHKVIEIKISVDSRQSASKTSTLDLDMRRTDFRLLRELMSDIAWENAFSGVWIYQHLLKCFSGTSVQVGGPVPVYLVPLGLWSVSAS